MHTANRQVLCRGEVLVIVSQASLARFWSKAAQHRFHADWRDRSFLELFGEWPSCWLTLASRLSRRYVAETVEKPRAMVKTEDIAKSKRLEFS